jgi:hypothetical protein
MKKLLYKIELNTYRFAAWLSRRRPGAERRKAAAGRAEFANIGEGTYVEGQKSYLPDASATSRYLLYKQGSDADHCAVTGAGDVPLGSSDDQADATNLVPITLNLFGAVRGTVRVVTDGTVNNGTKVTTGANGQVTAATSGNLSFGVAVITTDASANAGDVITMIPCLPLKYAF